MALTREIQPEQQVREKTLSPYLALPGFRYARYRDQVDATGISNTPRRTSKLLEKSQVQPMPSRAIVAVRIV